MSYLKVSIGIFLALAASRFIPHPPNFTSLLALSFYVPVLLGLRFIPALLIAFALTDFIIGYHSGTHWTWGSVLIIGLMSQYFNKNISFTIKRNIMKSGYGQIYFGKYSAVIWLIISLLFLFY